MLKKPVLRISPFICCIFLFGVTAVLADETPSHDVALSLESFKKLPILDQGRTKPLETYAQNVLLQFSGKRFYNRYSAVEWLARLLFSPETTYEDKIFLINNPEVPLALGITPDHKRRYSFSQLAKGYHKLGELATEAAQIEEKKRSIVESELIRVYGNFILHLDLTQSFQFAFEHPDFEITDPQTLEHLKLSKDRSHYSFLDIALKADLIRDMATSIQNKQPDALSTLEKDVVRLMSNLFQWSNHYAKMPFSIVAPFSSGDEKWLSPWEAFTTGFQNDSVRNEIIFLRDLTLAYRNGDQKAFSEAAEAFFNSASARAENKKCFKLLSLELFYNKLKPFGYAQVFYYLALFVILFSFFKWQTAFYRLAWGLVVLGFIPHFFAIVLRCIILSRPPVSNLYETFIFVGFIAVLMGILIELGSRKKLGILVSSLCGSILLLIASKFSSDGDTMKIDRKSVV